MFDLAAWLETLGLGQYASGFAANDDDRDGLPYLSDQEPEEFGSSLAHLESKCTNIYDAAEVERVYYPEIEKLLLEFFPDATDALVYDHDVFDKDYQGDRTEDQ